VANFARFGRLLNHKIENSSAIRPDPLPDLAGLRILIVAPVPKIPRHRGPKLAERQRQALIEMVERCHAMRNRLSLTQQNIPGDKLNHLITSRTVGMLGCQAGQTPCHEVIYRDNLFWLTSLPADSAGRYTGGTKQQTEVAAHCPPLAGSNLNCPLNFVSLTPLRSAERASAPPFVSNS
jgi:hypothetical protein